MEYRVVVHRTVILQEHWNCEAKSEEEAYEMAYCMEGDFVSEETYETLDVENHSIQLRNVDPELAIDKGL